MTLHSNPHNEKGAPPEIDSQEDAPLDADSIDGIVPKNEKPRQKDVSLSKEKSLKKQWT